MQTNKPPFLRRLVICDFQQNCDSSVRAGIGRRGGAVEGLGITVLNGLSDVASGVYGTALDLELAVIFDMLKKGFYLFLPDVEQLAEIHDVGLDISVLCKGH